MSTFIIRNKETLEQWTASSGKNSWRKPNHAKAAFANSEYKNQSDPLLKDFIDGLGKYESLKFNNQDVYEVVELYSNAEKRVAVIETTMNEVKDTLADIKDQLASLQSLNTEDYDYLYGEIEHLQCKVCTALEYQLTRL